MAKYTGAGKILDSDYKYLKYVGKTKSNSPVKIELINAFCRSNPDWKFEEKNDTVPEIEFEGCYDDAALEAGNYDEPWRIDIADNLASGNAEILLGVGKIYVGELAPQYSATKTYVLNDLCMRDWTLYKCNTAITGDGEEWTAAHWTEIPPTCIGLTRGGGSFSVEKTFREINADNDPGAVMGRMEQTGARAKLKFNALQWLTKLPNLYSGIKTVTSE